MQKHMCGADAGNDIQGLSVRCPSQVEEIVPTLDDDLLYGFALSRTAEECHPTVRDLRAGECVLGLSPDRVAYANLSQPSLSAENLKKAYELRERVSEKERLRISADYYALVTGELEKEAQTYQLWIQSYPHDPIPHGNLGVNFISLGQYDKSLAESEESQRLGPNNFIGYLNLGLAYLALNRPDHAKATFEQALARKLDGGGLRLSLYYLGFLQGDSTQMEQQLAWGSGKPGVEDLLLSAQSDTEAYYGRLAKARDFSRRAVDSAVRTDSKETAALWQVNAAVREVEFGNVAAAKQGLASALALAPGRDVKVLAALAAARIGDTARAKTMVEQLEKSHPSNTVLKLYWLPTLKAAIELNVGNSSQALVSLEAAAPYELGEQLGTLFPAYLRGQAYLLAHNGTAAAGEFQKLVNHRGIVLNFRSVHSPISASLAPTPWSATRTKQRRRIRIS